MVNVDEEIKFLVEYIKVIGAKSPAHGNKYTVKYGKLVKDDKVVQTLEGVFGTLKAAKKRKIVDFKGELLLSPAHDDVDIVLLAE
ncbi:hypothetical protein BKA69DRAFT_1032890 [Paraphysoderma sedebokerense]|nr:hypothetical protein BKA69DRAFT_1032890 [Paraphysoderma sedebokerense]